MASRMKVGGTGSMAGWLYEDGVALYVRTSVDILGISQSPVACHRRQIGFACLVVFGLAGKGFRFPRTGPRLLVIDRGAGSVS